MLATHVRQIILLVAFIQDQIYGYGGNAKCRMLFRVKTDSMNTVTASQYATRQTTGFSEETMIPGYFVNVKYKELNLNRMYGSSHIYG